MKFFKKNKNIIFLPALIVILFFIFRIIYKDVISECAPTNLFSENSLEKENLELRAKCIKKALINDDKSLVMQYFKREESECRKMIENSSKMPQNLVRVRSFDEWKKLRLTDTSELICPF